jgi:hypothetical protein
MRHALRNKFFLFSGDNDHMIMLYDTNMNLLNSYTENEFEPMLPNSGDEVIFSKHDGTFIGNVSHVRYLTYKLVVKIILEHIKPYREQ